MSIANVARVSLDHLHADLQARYNRVKASLGSLKHQESEYARQHRVLLAAYSDLLAVAAEHLGTLAASTPAPTNPVEVADGPPCPACAHPSWKTDRPGIWRCTRAGCVIGHFGTGAPGFPSFLVTDPAKEHSHG
jgi:hypothetical protein